MVNFISQSSGARRQRTSAGLPPAAAFTLIELLVVIAIMVLLAGMIVAGVGVVGEKKRVAMAQTEIAKLATLISTYQAKKGLYPPDSPTYSADPTNTTLFYELAGAVRDPSDTFYTTPFCDVPKSTLLNATGVGGLVNSSGGGVEERADVLHLLEGAVRPEMTNSIVVNGARIVVFVAPEGPNGRVVNPINYRVGTNAVHNPGHFDLWAVVKTRSGSRVIGNWKE